MGVLTRDAAAVTQEESVPFHDVVVIGAGVTGIYALHRMKQLGLDVIVLEAADDLGGTWYWNRYPGARFDSESYTYAYSFSKELIDEWDWSELFAAQPETLEYLNYVADKFDLRPLMQFGCRVRRAVWDEDGRCWLIETEGGERLRTRLLMTALGSLSAETYPRYEGMDSFEGQSFHTHDWPHDPVDLDGKRVAVIGTGASGVQVISAIAETVEHLTVFQRRPNWCAPLRNRDLSSEEMEEIRDNYDAIFEQCRQTPGGFIHGPDRRKTTEVSPEERKAFWEQLYEAPGFGVWLGNFRDVYTDEAANGEFSDFIADKIRERVDDPELAEKLIPKDHGFGTRRVPLETDYYEVYNRPNVELVDLQEEPIVRVTPSGIETASRHHDFDIIVYATGFDAFTGPYDRMEFVGVDGLRLADKWQGSPLTYMGMQTAGFPNLITLSAPQGLAGSTNFPRGIEELVDWTVGFVQYMVEHGHTRVETTPEAEQGWFSHVKEMADRVLLTKVKSFLTGYNSNVDRPDQVRHVVYTGGTPRLREHLQTAAENDYEGFTFE